MFCRKCGNELKIGTRFCTKCGYQIEEKYIKMLEAAPADAPSPVEEVKAPVASVEMPRSEAEPEPSPIQAPVNEFKAEAAPAQAPVSEFKPEPVPVKAPVNEFKPEPTPVREPEPVRPARVVQMPQTNATRVEEAPVAANRAKDGRPTRVVRESKTQNKATKDKKTQVLFVVIIVLLIILIALVVGYIIDPGYSKVRGLFGAPEEEEAIIYDDEDESDEIDEEEDKKATVEVAEAAEEVAVPADTPIPTPTPEPTPEPRVFEPIDIDIDEEVRNIDSYVAEHEKYKNHYGHEKIKGISYYHQAGEAVIIYVDAGYNDWDVYREFHGLAPYYIKVEDDLGTNELYYWEGILIRCVDSEGVHDYNCENWEEYNELGEIAARDEGEVRAVIDERLN